MPGTIRQALRRLTNDLHAEGVLRAPYTSLDLRHLFAAKLYGETRDVLLVQSELGHTWVAITQVDLSGYLRAL